MVWSILIPDFHAYDMILAYSCQRFGGCRTSIVAQYQLSKFMESICRLRRCTHIKWVCENQQYTPCVTSNFLHLTSCLLVRSCAIFLHFTSCKIVCYICLCILKGIKGLRLV